MINSGDIINYQSEIWLSQEYILDKTNVQYNYLRVAKTRAKKDEAKAWQHTEIMNRCFFNYNSIPRSAITQLNPLTELIQQSTEIQDDISSIVSAATYSRYKLFISKMPKELAIAAAVVHEAAAYCNQNGIQFNKSHFFKKLSNEIELQQLRYLPKTWRNLRDKVRDYAQGEKITELVKAKNEGNDNRTAFANNELIKGWLFEMAESKKNYSYAFMWRKLKTMSMQHNINKVPSQRWVSDYLSKPETQFLIQQRYGSASRFNQRYRSYVPTQSALFAGDCWDIDGTRINIIDHSGSWIDRSGKRRTGQKFLYIIAVRDVMSGHVLGWEYCYEESAQAVTNALAMAIGASGYLPYEIRYDKFPGHNSEDWQWVETGLQQSGVIMTQTIKPEGKASIERWWGTLQNVFMMDSDLYYGEGIKSSRRYAHRAKEYIQQMRQKAIKAGFSYNDAVVEADTILSNYTNTPYSAYSEKYKKMEKSPLELHNECTRPNTIELEEPHFCYLFGLRKMVSIRNNMIMTQIENSTHYYLIDNVELIEKYTGVKLINCFDVTELSELHLFDGNNYLGTFKELTPAQQFGPKKDMRAVGKVKSLADKANAQRITKAKAIDLERMEAEEALDQDEAYTSPELGTMLIGRIKKNEYEDAESNYLRKEWSNEEDEEEIKINIQKEY